MPHGAIDSLDDQLDPPAATLPLKDVSTAERKDISSAIANNPGTPQGIVNLTEQQKPPWNTQKKKTRPGKSSRRETTTLRNKPQRRQPEGDIHRSRNKNCWRNTIYRIQYSTIWQGRKNDDKNQDSGK
jgi:hypothetical protein